jgi:hypothetical protein
MSFTLLFGTYLYCAAQSSVNPPARLLPTPTRQKDQVLVKKEESEGKH